MLSPGEFRPGMVSLPVSDADDVPACCLDYPYLQQKEFSTSEDAAYLYCCYNYADNIPDDHLSCLDSRNNGKVQLLTRRPKTD